MRLRIEKAVTDCLGLSHDESGRAVLIRGALPGEVVECTILDGAKGVLKAEAAEVLEPSPLRRVPICPYYGRCGGCSFVNIPYADELLDKRVAEEKQLSRFCRVAPILRSDRITGYRCKVQAVCGTERGKMVTGKTYVAFMWTENL